MQFSRSLNGLPLAWGAKAHASTCRRDPFYFAGRWGSGGICAPELVQRLSFFVGSDDEPTSFTLVGNSADSRRPTV
jgi:hypothetical protein